MEEDLAQRASCGENVQLLKGRGWYPVALCLWQESQAGGGATAQDDKGARQTT